MSNLRTVFEQMQAEGAFERIWANPLSQFGRPGRRLLGAEWMPERRVPNNEYTETAVKYRTIVANDGTRHSPAQKKGNDIVGSVKVELTDQDIAADFTAEDYDNLLAMHNLNNMNSNTNNPTMQGVIQVTNWYNTKIVLALKEKIEKMRWEAMVDASVPLRGDNGFSKNIAQPNPTGQRVAAGGVWSNDSYDPFDDIFAMMEYADSKGYKIGAFAAGNPVIFKLLNNAKVKAAIGGYVAVDSMGALVGAQGRVARGKLNDYLASHDLPSITPYNEQYRTQTGSVHFLKRDVLVAKAVTERNVEIDLADQEPLPMRDVVGYVGVGRPSGESAPGVATATEYVDKKPRLISAEAWQTTFPVETDPEAVFVINSIS